MKLEHIGFSTMYDKRVRELSGSSEMKRCELILTDLCTFRCPYCHGIREECRGNIPMEKARMIIDMWTENGLENLRFSGGEPTIWPGLPELVRYSKEKGARTIGVSSNGFSDISVYNELIDAGVDSFSISLDACDAEEGDRMSGGIKGSWNKVVNNIREISKRAKVSIGIVVTEETKARFLETLDYALSLGVYDVKIISATQYNELLSPAGNVDMGSREKHHFLNYRVENVIKGKNMRGLSEDDSHRCPLVMDDSSIAGNWHFPCSIYMREMGAPIGEVSGSMRHERILWAEQHDTHRDPICRKYCLDATRDFNNRYMYYKIKDQTVTPVLDPQAFSEEIFAEDGLIRIGAGDLCFDNAKDHRDLFLARNERAEYRLLGCCMTEDMPQCDNVENRVALMYEDNDAKRFWFVIRASEFMEMLSELQQEEHRSR